MIEAILGKKVGMMQRYAADGTVAAVTVIQAGPCHVMQVKTVEKDGYVAAQLGFEDKKRKVALKPEMGHARTSKAEPKRFMREVRFSGEELTVGAELTVAVLEGAVEVDVIGVTKGKGFQGVMKRHGFHGRPASHGASKDHRSPGSIGSSTTPGRTVKGRRMAGHMGMQRSTSRNLKLMEVDKENNLVVVRGAVPGPTGGYVVVRRSLAERQAKK